MQSTEVYCVRNDSLAVKVSDWAAENRPFDERCLHTGRGFILSGGDSFWGDGQHLNFSFSPRSSLLLFAFGLTIQDQQGRRHGNIGRPVAQQRETQTSELWHWKGCSIGPLAANFLLIS